ncbi:MAG: biotin--[acetyl-CoA-carboxylase] ligase [Kordiimonas sp.]
MPHGVGAHFYSNLDSTNAYAMELATSGERGPLWIVAGEQGAGRGRHGRNWTSKPGNLYCSLLFAPQIRPSEIAPLPFIVSLAVRDTFVKLGVDPAVAKCKWPNDVLLNEKKASGILIESSATSSSIDYLVIGIGLNLLHYPDEAVFEATSLAEATNKHVEVKTALAILADSLKQRLDTWKLGQFEPIRKEWLSCAWGFGKKRLVRTAKESFTGTLSDLNDQGAVNVILDDGSEKTIYVADVFPSNH